MRIWSIVAPSIAIVSMAILSTHRASAQDTAPQLTPAGRAVLQSKLAGDGRPANSLARSSLVRPAKPPVFPLPMCMFPGGLCGAVDRDGRVAVPPRYDWVGPFADGRAAVRLGGLYGFVDEQGHETVKPQYLVVDDYKFGFAQVDVAGKSGLIDRDGKMAIAPQYGFIEAIAPDRFRVSDVRQLGGMVGADDFSGSRLEFPATGGMISSIFAATSRATGIIDISGRVIEPVMSHWAFDDDDPSIAWVEKDKLWGLGLSDGSWLVEPRFEQPGSVSAGLARVTMNGKVGFIDRTGKFVIAPVFDKASPFMPDLGRASAQRDGISGVIDRTGAWIFQTHYQEVRPAISFSELHRSVFGWNFKNAEKWGLLDADGHVILDAAFDQPIQRCDDGRLSADKDMDSFYFRADGSPLQPPDGLLIAACGDAPPYIMKVGRKFELVDADSRPVTPQQFDMLFWAGRGAWNAALDGKWGRIGPDGHWLLEPKFSYLSNEKDLFVAAIDGKRGFMRSDGSWLIEPKFGAASHRDASSALVTVAGSTGVLRLADQSWIIPPRPGAMCDISHAVMWQHDNQRAILSPTGESWIDIGAERISDQLDAGLLTFLRDGKWGLSDTSGHVTLEPRFEAPVYFTPRLRGVAWAKHEGRWCAIDRRGDAVPGIACTDADPTGAPRTAFRCEVEP